MRRALKEGRFLRKAPYGYINRMEGSTKFIAPIEPAAGLVKWAFQSVAKNKYYTDQLWLKGKGLGINVSRQHFHRILRNPVYIGKVHVPAYKDEVEQYVNGKHEGIIPEHLFYKVQNILRKNGRPTHHTKIESDENLPLRGHLTCPRCNKVLTGSASKGRTRRYYYYHCISRCGFRFKVPQANEMFVATLKDFKIKPGRIKCYKTVLEELMKKKQGAGHNEKKKILAAIEKENTKISRARDLLLSRDIEPEDYREIKAVCQKKLNELEIKLAYTLPEKKENKKIFIDKALEALVNLEKMYEKGDVGIKRRIIGSIFPEKLSFSENNYRTTRINSAVELIYLIDNDLRAKKTKSNAIFLHYSHKVELKGFELETQIIHNQ